jgi:hypothetical protein
MTDATNNMPRGAGKSNNSESAVREEQVCLGQAKLMLRKFKARTMSPRKAEIAGLLAEAVARLENLAL